MEQGNNVPEIVKSMIFHRKTDWDWQKDRFDKKNAWEIERKNGNILVVFSERKKWKCGGITFCLKIYGKFEPIKILFTQSSINQFKNGKDLYENAIEYAEAIANAHYLAVE